ncbi:hypothetical protein PA7_27010 [Pseudonocardia asaccharolytica DSM 44247 = NBRC 16224]|uniref:FAD-binding domain-containing protein n=1 Tax=Pseudonocardia asaccharolytica DSM 44247 = NBRC 16224 TaxID=1123024 RepID=A0A511D5K8_9PSEU|nr:hypothetical protein PA7_27010 [Pseudonocardia asaccharolytica DSM 44247 = NBRC 16224]
MVGAGPAGLALALQAHAHGARVRIVERRPETFRPSRALVVHPRTLEVLRPLGVVDALLARADRAPRAQLHLGSRVVDVRLADLAIPDTAYPHLSLLRQADVEAVLGAALAERDVIVEHGIELLGLRDSADGPVVTLRSAAGVTETVCRFVAGCDGAGSTVRSATGIGWRGAPYREEIVLADVELAADLTPDVVHVVAGGHGLLFVFAIGERATWRLLATRPARAETADPRVPVTELQRLLDEAGLDGSITELAWSSRVRVAHRLADRYRRGAVFLAGDAAHTHSPAAAQGMNTGIQDAANLGWKLAYAADSIRPEALLDSYGHERRPVARQVLALTHLVFWAEAATNPVAVFLRGRLAPGAAGLLPTVLRRRRLIAEAVRVLSGLRVGYPRSALSVTGTPPPRGGPRAGDRLPDAAVSCEGRRTRLHELTARPGVHILLHRDAAPPRVGGPRLHVHRLTNMPGRGLLAVRPDGYVGLCTGEADDAGLSGWLARIGAGGG